MEVNWPKYKCRKYTLLEVLTYPWKLHHNQHGKHTHPPKSLQAPQIPSAFLSALVRLHLCRWVCMAGVLFLVWFLLLRLLILSVLWLLKSVPHYAVPAWPCPVTCWGQDSTSFFWLVETEPLWTFLSSSLWTCAFFSGSLGLEWPGGMVSVHWAFQVMAVVWVGCDMLCA